MHDTVDYQFVVRSSRPPINLLVLAAMQGTASVLMDGFTAAAEW
jgi:hypothetical protein